MIKALLVVYAERFMDFREDRFRDFFFRKNKSNQESRLRLQEKTIRRFNLWLMDFLLQRICVSDGQSVRTKQALFHKFLVRVSLLSLVGPLRMWRSVIGIIGQHLNRFGRLSESLSIQTQHSLSSLLNQRQNEGSEGELLRTSGA